MNAAHRKSIAWQFVNNRSKEIKAFVDQSRKGQFCFVPYAINKINLRKFFDGDQSCVASRDRSITIPPRSEIARRKMMT